MARFSEEQIRNTLAVMERGKGVAYFNNVCVTFNPHGEFIIFKGLNLNKNSITKSLSDAVDWVKLLLG